MVSVGDVYLPGDGGSPFRTEPESSSRTKAQAFTVEASVGRIGRLGGFVAVDSEGRVCRSGLTRARVGPEKPRNGRIGLRARMGGRSGRRLLARRPRGVLERVGRRKSFEGSLFGSVVERPGAVPLGPRWMYRGRGCETTMGCG